jgi:hypothetical protein
LVRYRWNRVVMGGGGYVTGLVTGGAGAIYARTDVGGAYRRRPEDAAWKPFGPTLPEQRWNEYGVDAIAVHPALPSTVVMTTGKRARTEPQGMPNDTTTSLLRTNDSGRTWTASRVPFAIEANGSARWGGERLAFAPAQRKTQATLFYASRYDGLWRSMDVGKTWMPVGALHAKGVYGRGLLFVATAAHPGGAIAVGVAGVGVFRSDDGGAKWRHLEGGPVSDPMRAVLAGPDLIVTECSPSNGLFRGAIWRHDGVAWQRLIKSDEAGFVGLAVDAQAPDHWIAAQYGWGPMQVLETHDRGGGWSPLPAAKLDRAGLPWNTHPFAQGVSQVALVLGELWVADGFGIWRRTGGKAEPWRAAGNGIEETVIWDLQSSPIDGAVLSALGDVDGFRHTDPGTAPQRHFDPPQLQHGTSIAQDRRGEVVARVGESWRQDIVAGGVSGDGGQTWRAFPTAPTDAQGGRVAVSSDGRTIVWLPKGHLPHVTSDGGRTWRRSKGVSAPAIVDFWQRDQPLAADAVDARRFYLWSDGALLVSDDGAASFRAGGRLPHAPADAAPMVRTQPGAGGVVWVALRAAGLHRSKDGGFTFEPVDGIEPRLMAFGRAREVGEAATLFVVGRMGKHRGLFRGDGAGARGWARIAGESHGLGNDPRALAADAKVYGRVYVGTFGSGIFYGDEEAER